MNRYSNTEEVFEALSNELHLAPTLESTKAYLDRLTEQARKLQRRARQNMRQVR